MIPSSSEMSAMKEVLTLLSGLALYGLVAQYMTDCLRTISQLALNHTLIRPFLPPKLRQGVIMRVVIDWQKGEF